MDILSIGKAVTSFLGGGSSIVDTVTKYFPPSMTEKEKAELSIKIKDAEAARDLQTQQLVNEATAQFNDRTKEMEGTASDLKEIRFFGPLMLFFRGSQRIVWGFGTFWIDCQWFFSGGTFTVKQENALIIINILVLGFLFGERAVKNVMPLIIKLMESKGGGK